MTDRTAAADGILERTPDGGVIRPSVVSVWRSAEGSKRIGA